ncbi:dnaJ homolog subfamily C member 30 [Sergentomyia squamirostris]
MLRKCLDLRSSQSCSSVSFVRFLTLTSRSYAKNHYDVLGLTPKATQNDIKAAYYKLSMQYHPDKNKESEEAVQKFRDITAAYEVLGTYRLRRLYDKGILHTNPDFKHSAEPEFKSPSEVQPDDDAQTKFYKSRFKRSEVPVNPEGPIFNFDMWTKEHYGASLGRNQKARAKYKKKVEDADLQREYSYVEYLLIGMVVVGVLTVYASYDQSRNDKVKEKPPETAD